MKLYFGPGTCALASLIALEEAGAPYTPVKLDMKAGEQRGEAFLAINPKGRVPALVTDRGVLTENPAILAYVAQANPQAKLAPLDDPFAFATVQAANAYMCATVHVVHAHKTRGARWSDDPAVIDNLKLKVTQNMADCFALIEREMIAGPWLLGDTYSVADAYLFTMARWLAVDDVDIARFPKVAAQYAAMEQRPAVQRALAVEAA